MKKKIFCFLLFVIIPALATFTSSLAMAESKDTSNPEVIIYDFDVDLYKFSGQNYKYKILAIGNNGKVDESVSGIYDFRINSKEAGLRFENGIAFRPIDDQNSMLVLVQHNCASGDHIRLFHFKVKDGEISKTGIPFWLSILPPLIAILLALVFREVIISLFAGIWVGAFIAFGLKPSMIIAGFFGVIDHYIIDALTDPGHISVIVFSTMIGGMVSIISKNGGMNGVVNSLSGFASSAKRTQFITWLLGLIIFFDDYANTLIVGNTMRPVTDKFRISREKLAYIVDSTAAPVASIALITTWVGAELGYIQDAVSNLDIRESSYSLFLGGLEYAYYPVLSLIFVLFLIIMSRDFGPMYTAEKRARMDGSAHPENTAEPGESQAAGAIRPRMINAILPVFTLVSVTIGGLIYSGYDASIWQDAGLSFMQKLSFTLGNADAYIGLLWGSLSGTFMALMLTISQRIMKLGEVMETLMTGFKSMLPAIIILILAWALAKVTQDLYTADFLTSLLDNTVSPYSLPVLTFLLAALISFATGSSWGTMAILFPLMLPTTWIICQTNGFTHTESMSILYPVISVILGGAVFGDHCSPISDTTILSSLASDCKHIDHVRTQLPYAIIVALVSLILILIAVYFKLNWIVSFLIGIMVLYLIVKFAGKKVGSPTRADRQT